MIYLANPSTEPIREAMRNSLLGAITTPRQGNRIDGIPLCLWAADNGCGPGVNGIGAGFPGYENYLHWLAIMRDQEGADPCDPDQSGCLFAVAPDVVADAAATLRRQSMMRMLEWIRHLGLPSAFVVQDGQERLPLPWDDCDVVFIGGSTGWKLGGHARLIVRQALDRGKHVHMGRVNSLKRLDYARAIGCDSVDGTYLKYGPDTNLPKLLGWLRATNNQLEMWNLIGESA